MSKKQIFDDIMNHFDSEEEEENEEAEYERNDNKRKNHRSSSSLTENMNNKIKEILPNIQNVEKKQKNKCETKRDIFGYFNNNIDNEDSEESNSNNVEKDKNNSSNNENSEKEIYENENNNEILINSNEQEEEEDNNIKENDSKNHISVHEIQNQSEKEENSEKNEEIKENNKNEKLETLYDKITSNNKEEDNSKEQINNENEDEKNDLINELYVKSPNNENLDSYEGEGFRFMDSFKPKPIPGSPNFSKRISVNNNINSFNLNSNNNISNINNNNNNNNLANFTETIETKIEGDLSSNKNLIKNNDLNKNYTHNSNIISLGKLPNKDSINPSDSIQILNINNNIIGEYQNIEDDEKEEQAFLEREELKREQHKAQLELEKRNKENKEEVKDKKNEEIKDNKNEEIKENKNEEIKNNIKEENEEDGKENVTEDEEEAQNQILNKLYIQEKIKKEKNNEKNMSNDKENIKEEVAADKKEKMKINNINNINSSNKDSSNEINDIKLREMSNKLLEQYKKAGDSKSKRQSGKDNKYKNNFINMTSVKKSHNNNNNNNNKDINPKYIYKKNIIISKKNNERFNSPSAKNNINNKNNITSEKSKKNIGDLSPSNPEFSIYFTNYSKSKDFKNKNELDSIKKNLYKPEHEIESKYMEPKTIKELPKEDYHFIPDIDKRSIEICKKDKNKRPNRPIGELLYEDANNKKEKLKKDYINMKNKIIKDSNIKKINNNSYTMAIDRINRKIDNAIKKYSKNGKISIVGMTQCIFELNLITELIKIKDNIEDINDDLDFVELQSIIESIKGKDVKKLKEVEFLEQLWFIINPSRTQYINSKILSDLLKALFSSKNSTKELENNIKKIFEKYNFNKNKDIDNDNESDNAIKEEEEESYTSPLRDKQYKKDEVWTLGKFIKVFLELKNNLKAYKDSSYQKGDKYNKFMEERNKDLTFEPNFTSNEFFYKHSKYNYDKDDNILNCLEKNNPKKKKHDFNKVFERFMAEKELHEKTLERLREIKRERELKMCTNIPKINKYIPPTKKEKKTDEQKILHKQYSFDIIPPKFKRIYEKRKKNNILDENCTFKPILTSNNEIMNRTFSNMKKMKKPKGYNEYVKRNRSILERKEYEKKIEEDKKCGKNYEKIKNMNIKPFNITDLNRSQKKMKKIDMSIPSFNNNRSLEKNSSKNNIDFMNNFEDEKIENIIDNVYITLDIKTPNGLIKHLKIYNKSDKDTIDLVNNFCKIYSINDDNRKIILKKVMNYKNAFYGRNLIDNNKKSGFMMSEDLETITNTYSNISNL